MPGLQKRLARYAQLYSRVGFVYQSRPLSGQELQEVIEHQWVQLGLDTALYERADAAVVNAIDQRPRLREHPADTSCSSVSLRLRGAVRPASSAALGITLDG